MPYFLPIKVAPAQNALEKCSICVVAADKAEPGVVQAAFGEVLRRALFLQPLRWVGR